MAAFLDSTECFWFSVKISVGGLSEDCSRGCIRNQDRRHVAGVTQTLIFAILCNLVFTVPGSRGLGSVSTIAAIYGGNNTTTVCGILSGTEKQSIQCWNSETRNSITILPSISFLGISGGNGVFCGLADEGLGLFCWNTDGRGRFKVKRISKNPFLSEVAVGESQICGLTNATDNIECWRWRTFSNPREGRFSAISAGRNFVCGIRQTDHTVHCWGSNAAVVNTPRIPSREPMGSVYAGGSHACGIDRNNGSVYCWGKNDSGQLSVPAPRRPFEFDSLALGENHSCGKRTADGTVVCWGFNSDQPGNLSFETIVAGDGFTCGVLSGNFSVFCWGGQAFESGAVLSSMPKILPRPCDPDSNPCPCGEYPGSSLLCANCRRICKPCGPPLRPGIPPPPPPPPPPPISSPPAPPRIVNKHSKGTVAFAVAGSAGTLIGILAVLWWIRAKFCSQGRVHDSAQQSPNAASPPAPRMTRRQSSRAMAMSRQRSGTSSKHGDQPEEFSFLFLSMITDNFSDEYKIGSGSFGKVYRATFPDGRAVAIKRSETPKGAKKYQETESAFESEIGFLSRLHHKHLVALVGFCDEREERLLVYEYMPNGSLHDHLHKTDELFRSSSPLNSWAVRIKIALDAARGIEYLHTYAVPPIIHRDIKSSNILLDGSWNARVSDFGLSLMGPEEEDSHLSLMAAGTVGYMDPEYYRLQHLTTKSDVYSFGVVLLEILTGQKAIHKPDGSGGPINVVDFALPRILADEVSGVLDPRLPPPRPHEIEAVSIVGYLAASCVNLEGKDRPSMTEIVAALERALTVCVQADAFSRSVSLTVTFAR